jgi:hypothetical protein
VGGGGGGGQVSAASASLEQEAGALSLAADEAGASNGALRQQLAAAEAQLYELSLRHAAEVRAASAAQPTPTTAQRPIRMQRHKAPPQTLPIPQRFDPDSALGSSAPLRARPCAGGGWMCWRTAAHTVDRRRRRSMQARAREAAEEKVLSLHAQRTESELRGATLVRQLALEAEGRTAEKVRAEPSRAERREGEQREHTDTHAHARRETEAERERERVCVRGGGAAVPQRPKKALGEARRGRG